MDQISPPDEFVEALTTLRGATIDGGLSYREVPAPRHLSPWAASIEIETNARVGDHPLGRATLVILFDYDQEDVWGGPLRIVGQARMRVDDEQSTDPVLGEVVWATFLHALESARAEAHSCLGTVTREISQTFGGLELRGSKLNADLRCSWSPVGIDLAPHLKGWSEALRENCGLLPDVVTPIEILHV